MTSSGNLSGIDLLMNPKKRASSSSDAMSSISSVSHHSHHSHQSNGGATRQINLPGHGMGVPDATVMHYDDDDEEPQQVLPPQQFQRPRSPEYRSVAASSVSSSVSGEEEGEEESEEDEEAPMSEEEIANKKREILYHLDRLEKKGVRLPRKFTMADGLKDMHDALERVKLDREVDAGVKFQRKMLMACVTGIEFLNSKFDPFDVKLDGWSDSLNENIPEYDDVFEELYVKYRGKAKMAPELKLMFMVGGSGLMFHLTNTMFRSAVQPPPAPPQYQQSQDGGRRQGPPPPPPQAQGGGGGGIFGMLGNMFGGGGSPMGGLMGSMGSMGPGGPGGMRMPPPPQNTYAMKGPTNVDDILKELHHDAFPPRYDNARIEIISNASDTDGSDTASVTPTPKPKARRPAARKGGVTVTL